MFPNALEIAMQRRQFEREAENNRLVRQIRQDANRPTLIERIGVWLNLRKNPMHSAHAEPCPETQPAKRAALQS